MIHCCFHSRGLSFLLDAPFVPHTDRMHMYNSPTTLSKVQIIQTLHLPGLLYFGAIFTQPGPIGFIYVEDNPPLNFKQ